MPGAADLARAPFCGIGDVAGVIDRRLSHIQPHRTHRDRRHARGARPGGEARAGLREQSVRDLAADDRLRSDGERERLRRGRIGPVSDKHGEIERTRRGRRAAEDTRRAQRETVWQRPALQRPHIGARAAGREERLRVARTDDTAGQRRVGVDRRPSGCGGDRRESEVRRVRDIRDARGKGADHHARTGGELGAAGGEFGEIDRRQADRDGESPAQARQQRREVGIRARVRDVPIHDRLLRRRGERRRIEDPERHLLAHHTERGRVHRGAGREVRGRDGRDADADAGGGHLHEAGIRRGGRTGERLDLRGRERRAGAACAQPRRTRAPLGRFVPSARLKPLLIWALKWMVALRPGQERQHQQECGERYFHGQAHALIANPVPRPVTDFAMGDCPETSLPRARRRYPPAGRAPAIFCHRSRTED